MAKKATASAKKKAAKRTLIDTGTDVTPEKDGTLEPRFRPLSSSSLSVERDASATVTRRSTYEERDLGANSQIDCRCDHLAYND